MAGNVRARGLAGGVSHDTIVCIMIGGRPGCWVCHDTMPRHDRTCTMIWTGGARYDALRDDTALTA